MVLKQTIAVTTSGRKRTFNHQKTIFLTLDFSARQVSYLVGLLGLGGGDHPDQGPIPVVAVGAVHQELVLGSANPLPFSVPLPEEQWTVKKINKHGQNKYL